MTTNEKVARRKLSLLESSAKELNQCQQSPQAHRACIFRPIMNTNSDST